MMTKNTSIALFKKKGLRTAVIIVCSLFISGHCFSRKHWDREDFLINHYNSFYLLVIPFIDYNFVPDSEHAYLEWCTFEFSTDGKNYKTLAKCETKDQNFSETSISKMTGKLKYAKIYFYRTNYLMKKYIWEELTDLWVVVDTHNDKGFILMEWEVEPGVKIQNFRLTGKWHVNGLYCSDYIEGEVFNVPVTTSLKTTESTNAQLKGLNEQGADQRKTVSVKLSKHSDFVVITGTEPGENITIFTTSGVKVNKIVANDNVVKIKLPVNQFYILKIGQKSYKIAL